MKTYDVYEIYYRGNISNCENEDFQENVFDEGDWDLVKTYTDEKEAYRMWRNKWSKMAKTTVDEDGFFTAYVYSFEITERDENDEPIESVCIDYSYKEPKAEKPEDEYDRLENVYKEVEDLKNIAFDDYRSDLQFYGEFTYDTEESKKKYDILKQVYELLGELVE